MIKKNANVNGMLRAFLKSSTSVTAKDDDNTRCVTCEKGGYTASFYFAKDGSYSSASFGAYDAYDDFGWILTVQGEYDVKELFANVTHKLLDIILSETWGGKRYAAEFILDWMLDK